MLSAQHRLNIAPDAMSMLDSLSPEALAGIADHVSALNHPAPESTRRKQASLTD